MKYSILINQKAAIDSGLELDIVDLAIFELLKDFANSTSCKKMQHTDGKQYFLFSWRLVLLQLPILGLNSRQSVSKRYDRLKEAEVIIPCVENSALNQSWYRFGRNYDLLLFKNDSNETLQPANESYPPANESLQEPVNESLHNKTIINNSINNNGGQPSQTKEEKIYSAKVKFCKKVIAFIKTNDGKFPKLMYVDFCSYWMEQSESGKMRFQDYKFFEVGRRLSTWFKNSKPEELTKQWEAEQSTGAVNILLSKFL